MNSPKRVNYYNSRIIPLIEPKSNSYPFTLNKRALERWNTSTRVYNFREVIEDAFFAKYSSLWKLINTMEGDPRIHTGTWKTALRGLTLPKGSHSLLS